MLLIDASLSVICSNQQVGFYDYYNIRFEPFPVSAISGTGTGELLDLVCSGIQKVEVCFA